MTNDVSVEVEVSIWHCKNGHALGIVQRGRKGAARLILYRNAVDDLAGEPAQVDVIAVVEAAVDIRCSICDEMRTWAPNQAAFERLMRHYAPKESKIIPCSQEKIRPETLPQ